VTLRRVRVGSSEVALDLVQSSGEMTLHIRNDGAPVKMSFDPELPLGATVRSAHIGGREIAATLAQHPQDTHAHTELNLPRGDVELSLFYNGGVAIVPLIPRPVIGSRSRAMKVVSTSLNDRVYTIELDHLAAESASLELRTPWKVDAVNGARFESVAPASYRLEIDAAPSKEPDAYQRSKVIVNFASDQ
jgi:hypothetical protein